MIRKLRLKKIKALNNIVLCEDEKRNRWLISKDSYDSFKFTGFPYIPKTIETKISDLLKDLDYFSLNKNERHKLIISLIEKFSNSPIEHIFPSFSLIND